MRTAGFAEAPPMISSVLAALQIYQTPYSYMRIVAFVAATAVLSELNRRQGIGVRKTVLIAVICGPLAVQGARFLDMLESAHNYRSFAALLDRDGASVYGALIVAFTAIWFCASLFGVARWRFLDAAAPATALADSIGRVGCYMAGCCYGTPWNGRWAVTYRPGTIAFKEQLESRVIEAGATHSLPVHPVQLYSTFLGIAATLYLLRAFFRRQYDGTVFCRFLLVYAISRLIIIPVRADALATMKAFSGIFIITGVVGLLLLRNNDGTSIVSTAPVSQEGPG
jgi:phosphatidylglycerol:prolipoprotein diacylglycerol transferase